MIIDEKDLEKFEEAPAKGQMLVYTREKVIFKSYKSLQEFWAEIRGMDVLEIHLFDDNKEYRGIVSGKSKGKNIPHMITHATGFSEADTEHVYAETAMLENNGKIKILNHIEYDPETGMAYVDDYRLVMEG